MVFVCLFVFAFFGLVSVNMNFGQALVSAA